MDYETTLRVAMHSYPSLHPSEWKALESFLFTLGNGMYWKGGELVLPPEYSNDPDEEIRRIRQRHIEAEQRALAQEEAASDDERCTWTLDYHRARLVLVQAPVEEQWAAEIVSQRERLSKASFERKSARDCWRPLRGGKVAAVAYPCGTTYGAINQIPPDVTASWRKALCKCRGYIHSRHIQFRSPAEREHALMRLNAALGEVS